MVWHFCGLATLSILFRFVCEHVGESPNLMAHCSTCTLLKYDFSTRRIMIAWIDRSLPVQPNCCTNASIFFGIWYCTTIHTHCRSSPFVTVNESILILSYVESPSTIPHASVQHRPRTSPFLYTIIIFFLNSSDIPEWYHNI